MMTFIPVGSFGKFWQVFEKRITFMKIRLMGMVAGLLLMLGQVGQVSADILLTDWAALGSTGVTVLDKKFTWLSDTIPDTTVGDDPSVNISEVAGEWIVELSNAANISAGVYTLEYKIEITDPDYAFATVSLDSDVSSTRRDVKVDKQVFSDAFVTQISTLTSLSGANVGPVNFGGNYQTIWVRDTFSIDQGFADGPGILVSSSNKFTQQSIPEPATLAVWGGLAGLALVIRRRRQG